MPCFKYIKEILGHGFVFKRDYITSYGTIAFIRKKDRQSYKSLSQYTIVYVFFIGEICYLPSGFGPREGDKQFHQVYNLIYKCVMIHWNDFRSSSRNLYLVPGRWRP